MASISNWICATRRSLFLIIMVAWGVSAHAQIPVTDIAAATQRATNQVQTITQMVQQYQQMLQQYTQMVQQVQTTEQQLASITGVRSLGAALLNNGAVRQQLPPGFSSMMSSIMTTGASGGSAVAQGIYSQVHSIPCSTWGGSANSLAACQAPGMLSASTSDTVTNALNSATQRVSQLAGLSQQVDASTDPKATADLQARIAAEQTQLLAERTMVDYAVQVQQAELSLAVQHQQDIGVQMLTTRSNTCYVCP